MGSLPDSKYIIQTDGYWFVEAHDVDSSKGYVTVSAKGIANGLSDRPNDDCDFGPDSYNPNYSGSGIPYTQTSGYSEAYNYCVTNGVNLIGKPGIVDIDSTWLLPDNNGEDTNFKRISVYGVVFQPSASFVGGSSVDMIQSNYAKTSSGKGLTNMILEGFYFANPSNTTLHSFANFTANEASNGMRWVEFAVDPSATNVSYTLILNGNEDSYLVRFRGAGISGGITSCPPIQWSVPQGMAFIDGGNIPNLELDYVTFSISHVVAGAYVSGSAAPTWIKLLSGAGSKRKLFINDVWSQFTNSFIDLNGNNVNSIDISNLYLLVPNDFSIIQDSTSSNAYVFSLLVNHFVNIGASTGVNIGAASPNSAAAAGTYIKDYFDNGTLTDGSVDNLLPESNETAHYEWRLTGNTYALVPICSFGQLSLGNIGHGSFPRPVLAYVPVTFNPTSSAAATFTYSRGPTTPPANTIVSDTVPAGATAGVTKTYTLLIKPGDYWEWNGTNVSLGTQIYEEIQE